MGICSIFNCEYDIILGDNNRPWKLYRYSKGREVIAVIILYYMKIYIIFKILERILNYYIFFQNLCNNLYFLSSILLGH